MDDKLTPEGIDFFEFLNEVWKAKWIFISIILITTSLFGSYAAINEQRESASSNTDEQVPEIFNAAFTFIIDPVFEPYGRSSAELWAQFESLLPQSSDFQIINDNLIPSRNTLPDIIYTGNFSTYNGIVNLQIKNGNLELAEDIRDSFNEAARIQLEKTVAQVRADLELLRDMPLSELGLGNDTYFREYFLYSRFLNTPAVASGDHRFFVFYPAVEIAQERSPNPQGTSERSLVKMLVLGGLVGLFLACFVIVVRIGIYRNMSVVE